MYPFSGGSGGSTTAASVSPAIRVTSVQGARRAVREGRRRRSASSRRTLVAEGGRIFVKGNPSKGLAWKDACKLIGTEPISVDGEWEDGLSSSGTSGVQFAEAQVDIETGIVKVTRILAMQDCGLIVDKLTAESQVYGGVIAAINFALFEDRHPRSQHRPDGQSEHGVVHAGRHVGRAEDRHRARTTCRSAASSASASRRPCRPRRRSRTRSATRPARRFAACRCIRTRCWRRSSRKEQEGRCEGLRLRQSGEREGRGRRAEGGRRLDGVAARRRAGSAGADEGLHHHARPHRQHQRARRDDCRDAGRRAADRLGGEDRRPRRARAGRAAVSGADRSAAGEVGTPQIRNQGTVGGNINQRPRCWYFRNEEFVCFKKGGIALLRDDGREPVSRDLRQRGPEPHRAPVEPGGAVRRLRRDVPRPRAERRARRCRPPSTSRCRPCGTC